MRFNSNLRISSLAPPIRNWIQKTKARV